MTDRTDPPPAIDQSGLAAPCGHPTCPPAVCGVALRAFEEAAADAPEGNLVPGFILG